MTAIGFVGLGNMGLPMALNLLKAGHSVIGHDLNAAMVAKLVAAGGNAARDLGELCAGADVVITMLPEGRHVGAIYTEPSGIIASVKPTTLLLDCSTIDVETSRDVNAAAARAGLAMLDAPVSGGTIGAEAATLAFMVGGEADVFERARPLLECMGKTIVHAGPAGNGQAAKICNNMLAGISMIAVSEAFVLAEKLGLDPQKLFDISSKSSGQCWSLTTYCPVPGPVPASPANRDFAPGFTTAMMLKDMRLSQAAARGAGATTPLGAQAAEIYATFAESGGSARDFSGVINHVRWLKK